MFLHSIFFPPKNFYISFPSKLTKTFVPPKMPNFPPQIGIMKISASFHPWDGRPWVLRICAIHQHFRCILFCVAFFSALHFCLFLACLLSYSLGRSLAWRQSNRRGFCLRHPRLSIGRETEERTIWQRDLRRQRDRERQSCWATERRTPIVSHKWRSDVWLSVNSISKQPLNIARKFSRYRLGFDEA